MRLANVDERAVIITAGGAVDVERHSGSEFSADPAALYPRWDEFRSWAETVEDGSGEPFDETRLGAPSPRPRQVFAVGLNYPPHAIEAGFEPPRDPLIFTKFPCCVAGARSVLPLPSGFVDWEVELVAVISRTAHHVEAADAWSYIAGLTVGQDFSEREVQARGPAPQFSFGKSFPNFAPTGPWLVTPDELPDPEDLAIECLIDGVAVQKGRTKDMLFPVADLIAYVSAVCTMYPGDLLFTGTPDGTGAARSPQRFLRVGERVVSRVEGLGSMHNLCVPAGNEF